MDKVWPSVTSFLDGTFPNGDEPGSVYLFSMKNHPGLYKPGIEQLKTKKSRLRAGDPEYGSPLWESCLDSAVAEHVGDIPMSNCWLFDQYALATNIRYVEQIPILVKRKWKGYTETLRLADTEVCGFKDWLSQECGRLFSSSYDGLETCFDQLVVSQEERVLYRIIQEQWAQNPDYNGIFEEDPTEALKRKAKKQVDLYQVSAKNNPDIPGKIMWDLIFTQDSSKEEDNIESFDRMLKQYSAIFRHIKKRHPELEDESLWSIIHSVDIIEKWKKVAERKIYTSCMNDLVLFD